MENQEQLDSLLLASLQEAIDFEGLCLYGVKDWVQESVYVMSSLAQGGKNAATFVRLGESVQQRKETVASSRRLARWVGALASMITQDTQGRDFDDEFTVLEKMIERKTNGQDSREEETGAEFVVIPGQVEKDQDPRE